METVVIKVPMHCKGCVKDIEKAILNLKGVQVAEADFKGKKFTVSGTMNPKDLVDRIRKKTGKKAEVVKKDDKATEGNVHNVPMHLINHSLTPQIFSDDNPHACSIM